MVTYITELHAVNNKFTYISCSIELFSKQDIANKINTMARKLSELHQLWPAYKLLRSNNMYIRTELSFCYKSTEVKNFLPMWLAANCLSAH